MMAFVFLVVFSALFIIEWTYYFILSFNSKNEKVVTFLKLYAMIICKNYQEEDEASKLPTKDNSVNKIKPKKHKKLKLVKKRACKHVIKGQREDAGLEYFGTNGIGSDNRLKHDPQGEIQSKRIFEESKSDPKDDSSSYSQEMAQVLNIAEAKNKSSFARKRKQELGLTWLDDASSSDSQ